jgi:mobilome CxxCx(11)CxxC protein
MPSVEFLWELSAALLLIVTIAKLVYRAQERAENHTRLIGENIGVAAQVDYLLTLFRKGSLNDDAVNLFLLPSELDKVDAEALSDVQDAEKRDAYRNALKQMEPDAVCRSCGASPWQYTSGSCQMCGNTPKQGGTP